jgi:TolB protein
MASALVLAACTDDSTAPTPVGDVVVTTATTGDSQDGDGYAVTVAGGTALAIGINATVTASDVATGTQEVELIGIADNCSVGGDNPREVDVTDGGTTATTFAVSCLLVLSDRISITTDRTGDFEIFLVDPDGSNAVNVTNNPALDAAGAISPDGTRITFTSDRSGNVEVYVMNADGSDVTRLTDTPAWENFPAWSPDGSRIAFRSVPFTGDSQIWVMDADGSNQTNLTNTPGFGHQFNDWSPDGSQIVFATDRDGNAEVYVMDADGSNQANLTNHPAADLGGIWSPDGEQILFTSSRDGNQEVYVMNANGSSQTNLTNHAADDTFAIWSPDGTLIAFTSNRTGGDRDVYIMTAAGVGATPLTVNDSTDFAGPHQGWR